MLNFSNKVCLLCFKDVHDLDYYYEYNYYDGAYLEQQAAEVSARACVCVVP